MGNPSVPDDDVALVYIRLVRKESPDAAAVLGQIYQQFGARAALNAALVLTLLKQEIQHNHSLPEMTSYTHLLKDYPEAMPFLSVAITCCLHDWSLAEIDPQEWEKWQSRLQTQSTARLAPFEDLIALVRRYNPITAIKLEQIYKNYGVTAGGYAATALIWLAASIEKFGNGVHNDLAERKLWNFSYLEYMSTDQEAIDQFIDLLDCYRIEQRPTSSSAFTAEHDAMQDEQSATGLEDNS
jgi:hypothetical protein